MSIFNTPKPMLNPVLWTADKHLKPEARQHFIDLAATIYPPTKMFSLVMLGSSVSHQYNDTSDIDLCITAVTGEDYDLWHPIFKAFNSEMHYYPGTKHPINIMFMEYTPAGDWYNSLGAYDVLNDVWLKAPISFESLGDPIKKYEREIAYGHLLLSMIGSEVEAIRKSVVAGNRADFERRLKELSKTFHKIDENRKLSYKYKIGMPALQENNILYKLIEDSKYAELFHYLIDHYSSEEF